MVLDLAGHDVEGEGPAAGWQEFSAPCQHSKDQSDKSFCPFGALQKSCPSSRFKFEMSGAVFHVLYSASCSATTRLFNSALKVARAVRVLTGSWYLTSLHSLLPVLEVFLSSFFRPRRRSVPSVWQSRLRSQTFEKQKQT